MKRLHRQKFKINVLIFKWNKIGFRILGFTVLGFRIKILINKIGFNK